MAATILVQLNLPRLEILHAVDTVLPGTKFVIVRNAAGQFAGLPQNAVVTAPSGAEFSISYLGGDGNDVELTCLRGASAVIVRITQITATGGIVRVCWNSIPGRQYQLQQRADLQHSWETASRVITASGTTTCWSAPLDPAKASSLFQVVLLEP